MSDEVEVKDAEVVSEAVESKEVVKKEDNGKRVYELGYHLVPSYKEDEAIAEAGKIRAAIEADGGSIIAEEMPKEFTLAYEMVKAIANKKQKFTNSFFGWVKFEIEPSKAMAMKDALLNDDRFVRTLIIKTVRENTLASRRVNMGMTNRKRFTAKREDTEPVVEVNKEEVDKKLDELLATE